MVILLHNTYWRGSLYRMQPRVIPACGPHLLGKQARHVLDQPPNGRLFVVAPRACRSPGSGHIALSLFIQPCWIGARRMAKIFA